MKYAGGNGARQRTNNNQRTYSSQLEQTASLTGYTSLVYATGFKILVWDINLQGVTDLSIG